MSPSKLKKLKKEYERMIKELEGHEEGTEKSESLFRNATGSWSDFDTESFKRKVLEGRGESLKEG